MKKWILSIGGVVALLVILFVGFTLLFPGKAVELATGLERSKAGLEVKNIEIDGVRMPYLIGGKGDPLVLVHGFAGSKDHWTWVAKSLGRHFTIIAPDLPGCGESAKDPKLDYTIAKQVQRLHAFTKALGLKTFDLAGNSMGGTIAGVYAARYPRQVKSLWLLAPGEVQSSQPSKRHLLMKKGINVLVPKDRREFDLVNGMCFVNPPYIPDFILSYMAEKYIADRALYEVIFKQIDGSPTCLECELAKVSAPTLIMWGDKDQLTHVSGAEAIKKRMPGATVVIMKDVGHMPMMEKPELSAKHYLEFRGLKP